MSDEDEGALPNSRCQARSDSRPVAADDLTARRTAAQGGRAALEHDVDVKAGAIFLVGHAGESLLIHLLDGFDFATRRGDLGGDFINRFLQRFFASGAVQNEQSFVSFHCFLSFGGAFMTPLNLFIVFILINFVLL